MIRTGWITGSRPDAAIFFPDQIGIRQLFVVPKSPGDASLFMQILSERFSQSVRQRFGHGRAVVVVLALELLGELIGAMNGDCKSTEVIRERTLPACIGRHLAGLVRRNVIGQAMIELVRSLLHLLTQKIKRGYFFSVSVISVKVNVVADGVCRPKSIDPARNQEILCYNPFKELLRIVEKCTRFFSDLWIIENGRVTTAQFPCMKERRPIDILDQITHRDRYFRRSINPHS